MNPFGLLDNQVHSEILDDRTFKFRMIIFNEDGKFIMVKKSAIEELIIVDDIADMCHHGTVVIKNPHEVLLRTTRSYLTKQKTDVEPYRFRGDARDFIVFEMFPLIDESAIGSEDFDNEFYGLKFTFCVTNVEDLPVNTAVDKKIKLTFHDKRLQQLLERDLYWNTGIASVRQKLVAHKKPLSKLTDDERSIYTGAGIRDILQQTFGEEVNISEDWDDGGRKVFHTSPAGAKAYDDLVDMCTFHVSSDDTGNQPCILRLERHSNVWSLNPYTYYFNKAYNKSQSVAGPYQNETFYISNEVDKDGNKSNPTKGVSRSNSVVNNVHFPDLSLILDYAYNEMPGEFNQKYIVSTPVHTYHSVNKKFKFYYEKQSIENMFDFFEKNITINTKGGPTGPYTDFFITKGKLENRNVNLKNTRYTDDLGPMIPSRNDVLKKALFNGATIEFNVKGSTNRRAARFIHVDRQNPYLENDHDSKILGQYLVTNVKHVITQSGYFNSIVGVKPYFFNAVDYNHDIE